ncbi:hypothetical protein D3C76_484860 [compost metagenome]
MPHPIHDFVFIAPLGRQVEVVVGTDQQIQAAGISRISMENLAGLIAIEHAESGQFFLGAIGFFVVIGGLAGGDVFGAGGHTEVIVEITAFGRHPVEFPAHAPPERLEFSERCMGHRHHRDVMVRQVLVGPVDVVGQERATGTAFIPAFGEHEMVNDQLAAAIEQVGEFQFAIGSLEVVVLVDFHPGQGAPFCAEFVPLLGESLFVSQVLFARGEPFFPRHNGVVLNVHGVFSCRGLGRWPTQPSRLTGPPFDIPPVGRRKRCV